MSQLDDFPVMTEDESSQWAQLAQLRSVALREPALREIEEEMGEPYVPTLAPGLHSPEELRALPYDDYLQTPEWAALRREAIARARGRCQGCFTDRRLEVHHRFYSTRGMEDPVDLTVLCADCHEAIHTVADVRRGRSA